jgi:hypothetical protein
VHEEQDAESLTEAIAGRLLALFGLLAVGWVCWSAMASPFSDNSEFWPRFVLLSFLKQFSG